MEIIAKTWKHLRCNQLQRMQNYPVSISINHSRRETLTVIRAEGNGNVIAKFRGSEPRQRRVGDDDAKCCDTKSVLAKFPQQYWNNLLAISIFMFISNQESPLICEIPFSIFRSESQFCVKLNVHFLLPFWRSIYIRNALCGWNCSRLLKPPPHSMQGNMMRHALKMPIFNGKIMKKLAFYCLHADEDFSAR